MAKTLYLIDGHAQFFRAYHAIRPGSMSSPVTKEPTNLTYGFTAMLIKMLREQSPDYIAMVIDVSGDRESFRSELYPEYKANRESAPEDFHPQVERCLEILKYMHIPVFGMERVEADDVIATIATRLTHDDFTDVKVRIISRDKDLTQLINDQVELFDVHKDELVTPDKVFKSEGVEPSQVRDILALMGDTSDNVPGVPGIGPKTAAQLIKQYGSIDNLYTHIDEIKGKRKENLEASRDLVKLSAQLVTLKYDCDVDFKLEEAAYSPAQLNVAQLKNIFSDLGFNRHQQDIQELAGNASVEEFEEQTQSQTADAPTLFDNVEEEPRQTAVSDGAYQLIDNLDSLNELVSQIRDAGFMAFDTETDSLSPVNANLCGISVSLKSGTGAYIPTRSPSQEAHLDTQTVIENMREVFESKKIKKIGQNLKFDINILRTQGIKVKGVAFDTMIASYVIDATRSSHGLDSLAMAFLDHRCISIKELIGTGKKQITFDMVPIEDAYVYAAEDADITLKLHDVFAPMIDESGLRKLFGDVEMPLVEVLAELEYNGIRVDPEELDRQSEILRSRIAELRKHIIDAAPHPFNPDSPKQLAQVLFNKPDQEPPGLGLKVVKRRKTGPSTDVEVLEKLVANPLIETLIPQLMVEYRQLTKLESTYLVALKDAINPKTNRVHASFHQTVAATGRLSSSDPNLQNIPIRTDIGREIRRAFQAEKGNLLIAADYSQIELRILAHLSGDQALVDAFNQGEDIHTTVAAEVFGLQLDEVTSSQRNSAKMINFGIVYGITPYGLSRRLGDDVSVTEAAQIIDNYKSRFSRIDEFLKECVHTAEAKGYVETILGRRRAIPQIIATNQQQRALGERMAINSVVQGSAADLIKLAMIDLYRKLPAAFPQARLLLQIHDELILESPEAEAERVSDFVVEKMESAMELDVPLKVDSAVAASWIDAK